MATRVPGGPGLSVGSESWVPGPTTDAKTTRTPTGSMEQQQRPARPGAAAAPGTPSRSGPSAQPRNVAPSAPQGATSRTPTQAPKSESEKAAIQKRAEGRALVPLQFRDSFKHFFFSPTGMLKIFRLDLVNSFITAVFLLIVAILAMQEMERRHLFYVGGTQCLTAAIVCILDGIMVTKKITDKMRRMLGLEYESSSSLLLEPKRSGPTPAPGKAGTPGSSKPPTPAASKPPVAAPAKAPTQDLLNDLFAFIFLVGAVVIAVRSRQTMPMHYFIAV
ncbi:uncharacterized protein LOC102740756, partial [Leptonychotes weddellii]|uniref:Uncharacterized protein LOC102740756 n=1 Tax=Leptonychotes weddellii TaxID=9713 RepID=A0A2U3Z244_LEPWE